MISHAPGKATLRATVAHAGGHRSNSRASAGLTKRPANVNDARPPPGQTRKTIMKNMAFALSAATLGLALLASTPASAEGGKSACPVWRCGFNGLTLNGITLNSAKLNGINFNGLTLNGPVLQGTTLNGTALNGPVLQGINLNGMRMNGVADKAVQPQIVACEGKATQPCKPGVTAITLPSGQRLTVD
jgi:hypothetical protein